MNWVERGQRNLHLSHQTPCNFERYLVGPDNVHHIFLSEYKKAYPDAKLLGVAELVDKQKDLTFDGVWGRDPPETKYGFEDEIKSCHFTGFKNQDVAFYHPATKVMVTADLIFNLPATEQYSKSKSSGKTPVSMGPTGWIHSRLVSSLGLNKEAMKRDAQTVAGWDIEKIIMCHGDVIEKDGDKAWRAAYKFYLD